MNDRYICHVFQIFEQVYIPDDEPVSSKHVEE
jgi:hypothetical protein